MRAIGRESRAESTRDSFQIFSRARRGRRRRRARFAPKIVRGFCKICVDDARKTRETHAKMRAVGWRVVLLSIRHPQDYLKINERSETDLSPVCHEALNGVFTLLFHIDPLKQFETRPRALVGQRQNP